MQKNFQEKLETVAANTGRIQPCHKKHQYQVCLFLVWEKIFSDLFVCNYVCCRLNRAAAADQHQRMHLWTNVVAKQQQDASYCLKTRHCVRFLSALTQQSHLCEAPFRIQHCHSCEL